MSRMSQRVKLIAILFQNLKLSIDYRVMAL